ncbi:MAG: undecaprenyl-diphosphate phosphatase [Spirochaetaceae bacterium]|nr:undecaprenyl-diphosphate phosphatase [Spirochaetaceae bacterium]
MNIFQSICLGILQGITEFLPVSSSGHLAVAQKLFNLDEVPLIFDVCLHVATLFAVVLFFRKTIISLLAVFVRMVTRKPLDGDKPKQTTILSIIVATAITGVLGIVSSRFIEDAPIKLVCAGFILTGILLILATLLDKSGKSAVPAEEAADETAENDAVSIKQGIICGIAQGFGTLPGISRSGSTISAAILSGVNRKTAGEFSFILSIPAILGAFILEVKDLGEMASVVSVPCLAAGCLTAFLAGLGALFVLMKLIKTGRLGFFAIYLIPLGIAGLFLF